MGCASVHALSVVNVSGFKAILNGRVASEVDNKTDLLMRLRFLITMWLGLAGLLMATRVVAQPMPIGIDYLIPYTVNLADSPGRFRTADGQPMSFKSLPELTAKTRNGLLVEALNLYSNAVRPGDWHRLAQLQKLRLLAISVPDTMELALDSLLVNAAQLPNLEALRISFFRPERSPRRARPDTATTRQIPTPLAAQPSIVPVAGFAALQSLRLSGDQLPADQLIGRFADHPQLQRVELWGGWEVAQKALPGNLSRLPNLTELLVSGRGWQGWERAFRGLSGLRSLSLWTVSAGGPPARAHDEENPLIKAYQARHIADLNRALLYLTGLQQLELNTMAQVEALRLGSLPALTHLRLRNVTPSDTTFWGLVALTHLSVEECLLASLPAGVCDLSRLTDLALLNQRYTGVGSPGLKTLMPAGLSRLESLTALSIANNPIHPLPLQAGDLPRLRHLQLTACQLDLFPAFISSLQMLEYLDVGRNNLTAIPDTIQAWRQLDTLWLSDNRLKKLPAFLPQLKRLRLLAVGGNQLTQLPDQLGDLDSLRHLLIGDNALTSLPPSMSRLRQLQSVRIGKNFLSELPDWLGQLNALTDFSCDMPLTGLPASFVKLRQLKNLTLLNTRIQVIPAWISSLKQLTYIRLESDQIRSLPESMGRLANLETLSLTGKKFTRLPVNFGQLSQLRNLSIKGRNRDRGTSVTGSLSRLPASLVKCQKLYSLILTDQPQLEALTLFGQLARLPALSHLDLTGDRIRSLPPLNWASLHWHSVRLAENSLATPPSGMAQIPDLQMLDLRGNPLPEPLNRSFHNHQMIQDALLPATVNR